MTNLKAKHKRYYDKNREQILARRALRKADKDYAKKQPVYLCVNHSCPPKQAMPIAVASAIVKTWCEENPNELRDETKGKQQNNLSPYMTLAELSDVSGRVLFDIFHCRMGTGQRFSRGFVTVELMDRIITIGMGEPERWHTSPLDLYYLPLDEWTDEMRTRHAAL